MALDLQLFASKVRRYREQFAVSVEEVSRATGLAGHTVTALEDATLAPNGDQILILADYFKCDYKFFVSNEQLAPIDQTEKLFRRLGEELFPADRWAIQEFLLLCDNEAYLSHALGRPAPRTFHFVKRGKYFKAHGEQAASELRRFLGYQPTQVPVDVFDDLRSIGIHVFRRRLQNSNISGLFVKHPTAGKCVLINYDEDVYRQRFSGLHEGGHAVLDDTEDVVVSFTKWAKGDLVETRANTFAAHCLVPSEYVQRMPSVTWTDATVVEVAHKMRINVDVLLFAMQRERRMSAAQAKSFKGLKIERGQKADPELSLTLSKTQRESKTQLLERGLSGHYVGLCFDAYDSGLVSLGRLGELLLGSEDDVRGIGMLYGWRPKHDD
jgi:Zn-dependent peptidase ImmA (M78 family)